MALLFFKLDQKCLSWHYKKEKTTLGGDRTLDHKIKSLALYHLSYEGLLVLTAVPVPTRLQQWALTCVFCVRSERECCLDGRVV